MGLLALAATVARAEERTALTLLAQNCGDCHGADEAENGLDLTSAASVFRGSSAGPVVAPADARKSLLVQLLAKGSKPHMPPDEQLSDEEIATIAKWIDGLDPATRVGAKMVSAEARAHWAFQPLDRPAVSRVQSTDTWARTPIDRFVRDGLEEHDLRPNAEAERATLLRRLCFDLIGLPPTPDEIAAFESDDRPDAYERVVDRLLASPHYGERWGRHWLDLARYADSSGFHEDHDRPNAWRYRDYVVGSFNEDKPYARFVLEQVAGDELADANAETWIATGFGRNGPANETNMGKSPLALEQYRLDQLDGVVSTTSTVFLGLTLGCARCHDHKLDPLSQRDYYRFLAFFDSTAPRRVTLAEFDANRPELKPFSTKHDGRPFAMVLTDRSQKPRTTHVLWRGDPRNEGPAVEPGVPEVLATTRPFDGSTSSAFQQGAIGRRAALAEWMTAPDNPLLWRVMANRLWQHHFGRGLVASPSNFGLHGDPPTDPDLLDWLAGELRRSGGSLKSLHRVIVTSAVYRQSSAANAAGMKVDPENRLLWRMNRQRLEAEPARDAIVAVAGHLNTTMGGPGVKPRIRPDLLVASQRNKWPVVKREGPEHWRRSVYVYVKRQLQLPMLELLDAPSTNHSCSRRSESLAPTQALLLMNDEFVREQSAAFADRVVRESKRGDDRSHAETAFILALARPPSPREREDAAHFLDEQRRQLLAEGRTGDEASREALTDLCQVLFNLSEFVHVE